MLEDLAQPLERCQGRPVRIRLVRDEVGDRSVGTVLGDVSPVGHEAHLDRGDQISRLLQLQQRGLLLAGGHEHRIGVSEFQQSLSDAAREPRDRMRRTVLHLIIHLATPARLELMFES